MFDEMTVQEAAAILCLLMAGMDGEIRQEELVSMLSNPFFKSHVEDKIGPEKEFLKRYADAKNTIGPEALEAKALHELNTTFPAFKAKTLALMTLIAGANQNYHQNEKEFMARAAVELGVSVEDVQQEISRMKEGTSEEGPTHDDAASNEEAPNDKTSGDEAKNDEAPSNDKATSDNTTVSDEKTTNESPDTNQEESAASEETDKPNE